MRPPLVAEVQSQERARAGRQRRGRVPMMQMMRTSQQSQRGQQGQHEGVDMEDLVRGTEIRMTRVQSPPVQVVQAQVLHPVV